MFLLVFQRRAFYISLWLGDPIVRQAKLLTYRLMLIYMTLGGKWGVSFLFVVEECSNLRRELQLC